MLDFYLHIQEGNNETITRFKKERILQKKSE